MFYFKRRRHQVMPFAFAPLRESPYVDCVHKTHTEVQFSTGCVESGRYAACRDAIPLPCKRLSLLTLLGANELVTSEKDIPRPVTLRRRRSRIITFRVASPSPTDAYCGTSDAFHCSHLKQTLEKATYFIGKRFNHYNRPRTKR